MAAMGHTNILNSQNHRLLEAGTLHGNLTCEVWGSRAHYE